MDASKLLAQATADAARDAERLAALRTTTDEPAIKALIAQPGLSEFIKTQFNGITIQQIIDKLLFQPARYDIIEICNLGTDENKATFSAPQYHFLLYNYIVDRASAIAICEAEDYIVRQHLNCASDAAFCWVLRGVISPRVVRRRDDTGRIHRVIKLLFSKRALEILTDEPLRFTVQIGTKPGIRNMGPLSYAVFKFTQYDEGTHTEWDYVSKSYGVCFHGDEKYVCGKEMEAWRESQMMAVLERRDADADGLDG